MWLRQLMALKYALYLSVLRYLTVNYNSKGMRYGSDTYTLRK